METEEVKLSDKQKSEIKASIFKVRNELQRKK